MNVEDPKKLKPGEARSSGPSVQELMDQERISVSDTLRRETYVYSGSDDLDPARWTSQEFHDLEMEKVWKRVWQMACREEDIPDAGDHVVYDIGDYSFIVVRTNEGAINAYYNACLHRGTQLRPSGSQGSVPQFRCPFHGFTWNLEGALIDIPCRWDFPHVKDEDFQLPQVKVGTWGGFVFINMDPHSESLEDYLGDLPKEFKSWGYGDKVKIAHVGKRMDMNWKVGVEAFIESYHVVATHPQIMASTGDANTQYDVDPKENFNRMITPMGVSSPHLGDSVSEQQVVDAMTGRTRLGVDFDGLEVPEGTTARAFMAELRRQQVGETLNLDYSESTDSEMLDAIQYWVFPNFFPWGGAAQNIVYRFRPDGNRPDSCVMEVMYVADYDHSKPRPAPAPYRFLTDDESWMEATDEIGGLAAVFEQDVANMPQVHRGLKFMTKGVTLANYQESRIRHLHSKIDEYIAKD